MILVTGATGNVGGAVVDSLVAAGRPVRALVRDPSRASLPAGVEPAQGDLDHPQSVGLAAAGASAAFVLPGFSDMSAVMAELRRAGAEHVVLLSGASADGARDNAVTAYMAASEDAVRASHLAWTILRPSAFMANLLRWLPQLQHGDVVRGPWAHVRTAMIDPADIGDVAAAALGSPEHHGAVHRLSGPETLTPAEQLGILGSVLGRDLRFEGQGDDEARAEMLAAMPERYVDAFFRFYSGGELDESPVLPTVQRILRRPPRDLRSWCERHAARFTAR